MYRHIFFDLDRTLWDFQKNSAETLMDIYNEFSLTNVIKNQELFIDKFAFFNDHLWDNFRDGIIKKSDLRKERFRLVLNFFEIENEELVGKMSRYYLNTCPAKTALIPGTKEVLDYLYRKYSLYIISNGFYDVQLTKMISSGISRYFKKTFTSDQIGFAKPNVEIFNKALSSVNAKKIESLMIGDDVSNDIQGAGKANIDQVYLNREGKPSTYKPTHEITELTELFDIL